MGQHLDSKNTTPFFSVVIPTKNRSYLVGNAIQSLLNQIFPDFEIIVVDNDDTEETREVVLQFSDSRIRYFRTGNLSMPDNWEFGCVQARGTYLTILPDKQVLKRRALDKLYHLAEQEKHQSISWLVDGLWDHNPEKLSFVNLHLHSSREKRIIDSADLIHLFLHRHYREYQLLLPRGLNSCCHRSLIEKIKSSPVGRLCLPVAPDYTMAFNQLAYSDCILHLDEALAITTVRESTGVDFATKRGDGAAEFIKRIGGPDVLYHKMPIKTLLIHNSLLNDFSNIRDLVGGNLAGHEVPLTEYFTNCYSDITRNTQVGVDMSVETTEWTRALEAQEDHIQKEVIEAIKPFQAEVQKQRQKVRIKKLRSTIRRPLAAAGKKVGLHKLRDWLNSSHSSTPKPPAHFFPDIWAALKWEEEQLSNHPIRDDR